jgi:tellurite methyltransferase
MKTEPTGMAFPERGKRCETENGRGDCRNPEPEVRAIASLLHDLGASDALDLGCGSGRHSLMMAALGYTVLAVDTGGSNASCPASDGQTGSLRCVCGRITDLPCEDGSFDYLLAWDAIHRADRPTVERSLFEICRVLRPGGVLHGTILSKRNVLYGRGRQTPLGTVVPENDAHEETLPHFFCSQAELPALLAPLELLLVKDCENGSPGSYRLHFLAKKSNPGSHVFI